MTRGFRPYPAGGPAPAARTRASAPVVRRRTFNQSVLVLALQLGLGIRGATAGVNIRAEAGLRLTADSMHLISGIV